MINKHDYLKNYSNIEVICSMKMNNNNYSVGFPFSFDSTNIDRQFVDNEAEFLRLSQAIFKTLEHTILHENGFYEDLRKEHIEKGKQLRTDMENAKKKSVVSEE